jgi:hypothetical protein
MAVWPLTAHAQEPGRTYRLGSLHFSPLRAPHHVALFEELKRQGFIAGQNLWVDERGYGLHADHLPSMPRSWSKPTSTSSTVAAMRMFAPHYRRRRPSRS